MRPESLREMLAPAGLDPLRGKRIGVLCGGPSAERQVSLKSGAAVIAALQESGHSVTPLILEKTWTEAQARAAGVEVAFLALHGEYGEDGGMQRLLDRVGLPYTGSGAEASALAFDKILAKEAFVQAGVPTPGGLHLTRTDLAKVGGPRATPVSLPAVVKPASCGSSFGVTIVRMGEELEAAVATAFGYSDAILIEPFIAGRELTVAVLGESALPVIEIRTTREFFDSQAKYGDPRTEEICPAELPERVAREAQALALAAHRALGCRDVSRADIMLGEDGRMWVLEVNTLPGLTEHSLLPKAARAAGLTFTQMCEHLLRRALTRGVQTRETVRDVSVAAG